MYQATEVTIYDKFKINRNLCFLKITIKRFSKLQDFVTCIYAIISSYCICVENLRHIKLISIAFNARISFEIIYQSAATLCKS